jgi:hypothetical protein
VLVGSAVAVALGVALVGAAAAAADAADADGGSPAAPDAAAAAAAVAVAEAGSPLVCAPGVAAPEGGLDELPLVAEGSDPVGVAAPGVGTFAGVWACDDGSLEAGSAAGTGGSAELAELAADVWLAGFGAGFAACRGVAVARGAAAPGFAGATVCVTVACGAPWADAAAAAGPTVGVWVAFARGAPVGETLAFAATRVAVGGFGAWVGLTVAVGVSVGMAVGCGVAFRRFWMVWASGGPATTPVVAVAAVITRPMTAIPIGPRTNVPSMLRDS